MVKQKRGDVKSYIGISLSLVFLIITINKSGITLSDMHLSLTQWAYFLLAIIAFLTSLWIHSIRVKLMWVKSVSELPKIKSFSSLIIGNFYNAILPGNIGDGIRMWHLGLHMNVPFARTIAALIVEKWVDAQVFFFLVLIVACSTPSSSNIVLYALYATAIIILVLSLLQVALFTSKRFQKQILSLLMLFNKVGIVIVKLYFRTTILIKAMRTNRLHRFYVGLGIVMLCTNMLQFYLLLLASAVPAPIAGIYSSFVLALSMMIIAFIPSAPSSVGVIHYGVYTVLLFLSGQYNVELNQDALKSYGLFGILLHLSYFIPEVLLGLFYLNKERNILFRFSKQDTLV